MMKKVNFFQNLRPHIFLKLLFFQFLQVILSIKLLEEIEKKEALEKYGTEGSGKNLPFSSLSEDLKKKEKK